MIINFSRRRRRRTRASFTLVRAEPVSPFGAGELGSLPQAAAVLVGEAALALAGAAVLGAEAHARSAQAGAGREPLPAGGD